MKNKIIALALIFLFASTAWISIATLPQLFAYASTAVNWMGVVFLFIVIVFHYWLFTIIRKQLNKTIK